MLLLCHADSADANVNKLPLSVLASTHAYPKSSKEGDRHQLVPLKATGLLQTKNDGTTSYVLGAADAQIRCAVLAGHSDKASSK